MEANKERMEKLQKQYANDKEKYNQKVMEMYKENGMSMFSSCLPMILSMDIFFIAIGAFNSFAAYSNGKNYNTLVTSYNEKIEYFAVLPYERAIETKPHLAKKMPFVPKSIILYLLPYYVSECENISCYASSLDYHICIADINKRLENFLKSAYPCNSFQGYGDHSPIDERHAALISGLGIAGDNGLIINEKYGSYVFIADLISDVDPSLLGITPESEILRCEGCGACRLACPTGIIAKKAISVFRQQRKNVRPLRKKRRSLCENLTRYGAATYAKAPVPTIKIRR